jgi:hypothetical protein
VIPEVSTELEMELRAGRQRVEGVINSSATPSQPIAGLDDVTYLRGVLDGLDGLLVELADVGVEGVADVELLLNTGGVTAAQAALVNIVDPGNVRLEVAGLDVLLQGHDELAGDHLALDEALSGCGSSESTREQSSEEESEVAKVGHCGQLWTVRLVRGLC